MHRRPKVRSGGAVFCKSCRTRTHFSLANTEPKALSEMYISHELNHQLLESATSARRTINKKVWVKDPGSFTTTRETQQVTEFLCTRCFQSGVHLFWTLLDKSMLPPLCKHCIVRADAVPSHDHGGGVGSKTTIVTLRMTPKVKDLLVMVWEAMTARQVRKEQLITNRTVDEANLF